MANNHKPQAAILMATYNGEAFIEEQINSILGQTFDQFLLIIRDDGSTDKTLEIVNSFASKDKRIILLKNDSDKHGAYINFWNLIHYARSKVDVDYFFLADQDDIWELDKLDASIALMKTLDNNKPVLLYSDMAVIDENNTIIYPSYNKVMKIGKALPQATFYTRDLFWGCTMAFNLALLRKMPLLPIDDNRNKILSHDTFLAEFAALYGEVVFLDKVTINHRKHSKNVTGEATLKYSITTVLRKVFKSSFKEKSQKHARTYAQSLIALNTFQHHGFLTDEADRIKKSIEQGGLRGCLQLRRYKISKSNISRTILTYMIMFLKSYRRYIPYWMNQK